MISLVGNNLTAGYGGVDIIKNITLEVKQGEIAVIVGPNGAGKSTAMKALLGMLKLTDGSVSFAEADISNMLPQQSSLIHRLILTYQVKLSSQLIYLHRLVQQ
jgi:branched-chain amino acid transport system ATP-binding protein